jgi:hypothetical protein
MMPERLPYTAKSEHWFLRPGLFNRIRQVTGCVASKQATVSRAVPPTVKDHWCQEAPFLTFNGTLISDMSFETLAIQTCRSPEIGSRGAVNPTFSRAVVTCINTFQTCERKSPANVSITFSRQGRRSHPSNVTRRDDCLSASNTRAC